jgi:hypothetical protein
MRASTLVFRGTWTLEPELSRHLERGSWFDISRVKTLGASRDLLSSSRLAHFLLLCSRYRARRCRDRTTQNHSRRRNMFKAKHQWAGL